MNKRFKIAILAALTCGVAAIAATVVGYQDWQLRGSAPVTPGTGYYRTWADTSTGLVKCLQSSGAACYFAANNSALTLQHNGTNNGSQTLLNLAAGTNIALSDNGSGQILIDAAALSLLLKTNGTNNGSQSLLNLAAGAGMTLTDNGLGQVTLASTASSLTLQTNSTNNGSQSTLNLAAGAGMTATDNGTGTVTLTSTAAGSTRGIGMAFGMTGGSALSSGATQYVTVPFACTIVGWNMTVDAGTATVDVWKKAAGPIDWSAISGTVNTGGTGVTWLSGPTFPADAAGRGIYINSVLYGIASVPTSTTLVLTGSAGVQLGVAWAAPGTAVPTVSNKIDASALPAVASGTFAGSTSIGTWVNGVTGTTVLKNDVFGFYINTVATAKALSIVLECQQ
jgi:hypothetical protein